MAPRRPSPADRPADDSAHAEHEGHEPGGHPLEGRARGGQHCDDPGTAVPGRTGPAGHAGHGHGVGRDADRRLLSVALALIVAFMLVEVVTGLVSGSLALLADAGHMLTDAAAIGLGLVAMRLAGRPATAAYTYGLRRVEILSAQVNGITLLLLSLYFVIEGIRRLLAPPAVQGGLMLAVALAGIAVNVAATWVLSKANRSSLNIEGSFQHILTDLYAFVGTAVAAGVILTTGWERADPVATLLIAGLMTYAGTGLVRESGRVFLEAAPRGVDTAQIRATVLAAGGVREVHELHVWEVTSGFPALSAHVLVAEDYDCHGSRLDLERLLADQFGIDHTTLQVDHQQNSLGLPARPGGAHDTVRPADHPGHRGADDCPPPAR